FRRQPVDSRAGVAVIAVAAQMIRAQAVDVDVEDAHDDESIKKGACRYFNSYRCSWTRRGGAKRPDAFALPSRMLSRVFVTRISTLLVPACTRSVTSRRYGCHGATRPALPLIDTSSTSSPQSASR